MKWSAVVALLACSVASAQSAGSLYGQNLVQPNLARPNLYSDDYIGSAGTAGLDPYGVYGGSPSLERYGPYIPRYDYGYPGGFGVYGNYGDYYTDDWGYFGTGTYEMLDRPIDLYDDYYFDDRPFTNTWDW